MKLTLHHHVYSSVGGYKTLFASPTLPAPLVSDLEIFAWFMRDTRHYPGKVNTLTPINVIEPIFDMLKINDENE